MKALQTLLQQVQAAQPMHLLALEDCLAEADERSRTVVEAGVAVLKEQGLEEALIFLSGKMTSLLEQSRRALILTEEKALEDELA